MAFDIRRLEPAPDAPRPLHAVPDRPLKDPIGDEWLFGPKGSGPVRVTARPRGEIVKPASRVNPRLLWLLALALLAVIAALLIARTLGSDDAVTRAEPSPQAAAPTPAAPVPAEPTVSQPSGTPMSIVGSNISANTTAHTYRATVSVRNPTDVVAADISVEITLKDASGNVVKTENRRLEALASGGTTEVVLTGEFDPEQTPAAVEAKATAASSSA